MEFPRLTFSSAADNSRPFGSHRYDVYGPKIRRRLFLYGELPLNGFIAIESDPEISRYCERPVVITELKPRRVVDFWVQRSRGSELWLLLRPSELKWLDRKHPPTEAFNAWAEDHGLKIRLVTPESLGVGSILLGNWGDILRHLSANKKYTDSHLVNRVLELCQDEMSIKALQERLPEEDPVIVRTAIYTLLHNGMLVSNDILERRLSLQTSVRPK